jgi:hypothetical protein
MHTGTVSIENPGNFDLKSVLAMVVKEQSFGAALTFIVAGSPTNWIDVTPVLFNLRMDRWIAIHLTRGCLKNPDI